ncbi:hypothetical protein QR680_015213 [Steinernema hermaphroditum]|uniref:CHK kinase-like domain-containing protein n=1 Tax=Steinernema hermaphroditum TaxID=289476 RepID=A0AA39M5D7_9BILA|nr:hypothetical protein QR680_015213 [Steinernema hermaphroditum]
MVADIDVLSPRPPSPFPDGPLADSPYTISWFLKILSESSPEFCELLRKYELKSVSALNISGGKGFISKVYKCDIEFEGLEHPHEVVLKVPGVDAIKDVDKAIISEGDTSKINDQKIQHFIRFHNQECLFYNKYADKIAGFPMVQMYDTGNWVVDKTRGYLLMESMVGAAETYSIFQGFSKKQMLKIAEHLAHFHKHFLCMPDQSWTEELPLHLFQSPGALDFVEALLKKLSAMKPAIFEDRIKHVLGFSNSLKFHKYTTYDVYKDFGLPTVLTHGDMWTNNILWRKDSDEVAAFIDFQICHAGSPALDIARVLVLCSDGDVRREHEVDILKQYYRTLKRLLEIDGKSIEFTFQQLEGAYRVHLINQTIHLLFMVPFFCCGDHDENMKPIWEARTEKLMMRALFALDDALTVLETVPEEKYKE